MTWSKRAGSLLFAVRPSTGPICAAGEEVAARPEASLEDLVQQASVQRDVVVHVLALDEPLRSIVLLRFFEDHTPPQIAERLNVPLKTVHSRLARAFAKLRQRLDTEYGETREWAFAFIPLAAHPTPGSALFAPASHASTPLAKLVLAVTAIALSGWGMWRLNSTPPSPPGAEAPVPMLGSQERRSWRRRTASRVRWRSRSGRVALGRYLPRAPTDPDVRD